MLYKIKSDNMIEIMLNYKILKQVRTTRRREAPKDCASIMRMAKQFSRRHEDRFDKYCE